MVNSFLSSMIGMLDSQTVERIAACLGAPAQSVSRGFQSSIAAVLGMLAGKSEDSHALRGMLDLMPAALADTTISDIARAATDPSAPLISQGKQLLSGLFGKSAASVTGAVSEASGLRPGSASTIMAMAAPWVLSFVNRRVRAEGLSMTGLGNLLQHEAVAIRNALPASLNHLLWPDTVTAGSPGLPEAPPVESSPMRWLLPLLALAALIPTVFWLVNRHSDVKPSEVSEAPTGPNRVTNPITGDASRAANKSIDIVRGALADGVLRFGTGSSKLLPDSQAKLDRIAAALTAYPDVHATIAGYTDNGGDADVNLELSRQRANLVVAELVRKGVSASRLSAVGYGQEDPVADNSTPEGRAENRRVVVTVSMP